MPPTTLLEALTSLSLFGKGPMGTLADPVGCLDEVFDPSYEDSMVWSARSTFPSDSTSILSSSDSVDLNRYECPPTCRYHKLSDAIFSRTFCEVHQPPKRPPKTVTFDDLPPKEFRYLREPENVKGTRHRTLGVLPTITDEAYLGPLRHGISIPNLNPYEYYLRVPFSSYNLPPSSPTYAQAPTVPLLLTRSRTTSRFSNGRARDSTAIEFERVLDKHPKIIKVQGMYRELVPLYWNTSLAKDQFNLFFLHEGENPPQNRKIPVYPWPSLVHVDKHRAALLEELTCQQALFLSGDEPRLVRSNTELVSPRRIPRGPPPSCFVGSPPPRIQHLVDIAVLIPGGPNPRNIFQSGYRPPKLASSDTGLVATNNMDYYRSSDDDFEFKYACCDALVAALDNPRFRLTEGNPFQRLQNQGKRMKQAKGPQPHLLAKRLLSSIW